MNAPVLLPDVLKRARETAGLSQSELASELCRVTGTATLTRHEVSRWETGRRRPSAWLPALSAVLGVPLDVLEAAPDPRAFADDAEALELLARIESSDVSAATVQGIAARADAARCAYPVEPPAVLYGQVGAALREIMPLLEARATLAQRRELLVSAGWLTLIRACLAVDLDRQGAATRAANTARALGEHADHSEIVAWHHEIRAWRALLDDRHADVLNASATGLAHTGAATSVSAQLTAQTARAHARMKDGPATRRALDQLAAIAARLPASEAAGLDHFEFDPAKFLSYEATTLAWLGDGSPEAEWSAREVIKTYSGQRRLATAHLDLGMILAARGDLDAADHEGLAAVTTRLLVPSSLDRARELAAIVAPAGGDLPSAVRYLDERPGR